MRCGVIDRPEGMRTRARRPVAATLIEVPPERFHANATMQIFRIRLLPDPTSSGTRARADSSVESGATPMRYYFESLPLNSRR